MKKLLASVNFNDLHADPIGSALHNMLVCGDPARYRVVALVFGKDDFRLVAEECLSDATGTDSWRPTKMQPAIILAAALILSMAGTTDNATDKITWRRFGSTIVHTIEVTP